MNVYYGIITAHENHGQVYKFTMRTVPSWDRDKAKEKIIQFAVFDLDIATQCVRAIGKTPLVAVLMPNFREYQGKVYCDMIAQFVALSLKDMPSRGTVDAPPAAPIKPNLPKWETPDDDDIPF